VKTSFKSSAPKMVWNQVQNSTHWTLESRATNAKEPTRAVSMIMKTRSCHRSCPTRAHINTTMKEETVPNSQFKLGSGRVKRTDCPKWNHLGV